MKELFKSLSESVSEACFKDIVSMVEELINETTRELRYKAAQSSLPKREEEMKKVGKELGELVDKHNYVPDISSDLYKPKGWPYGNSKTVPEVEKKLDEFKKKITRRDEAKNVIDTKGEGTDYVLPKTPADRSFTSHEKIVKRRSASK